jgi:glutamate racemase
MRKAMRQPRILLFDSGMGGLTVARAVHRQMPLATLNYAADTSGFPYGAWEEQALVRRILRVMEELIAASSPDLVVIACNTASTIAMVQLRARFKLPFVGTVPAIKPAAAQTKSSLISVLATPGTVKREYTHALIKDFAQHCQVTLHGAPRLAQMAEAKLRGGHIDLEQLRIEVAPCFVENGDKRTDVVVLACTHYPLLESEIASVAPWPVSYIDPAPAIARRAGDILDETRLAETTSDAPRHGTVYLTSNVADQPTRAAYAQMGYPHLTVLDMPTS